MDGKHTVITGRKVLIGMIAFFGVIIAVNSAFVYFALDSWPGLTDNDSYNKGLSYNAELDAAAAQRLNGWQSDLSLATGGGESLLVATFTDADGAALGGLDVRATVRRPVGGKGPVDVSFTEVAAGTYHTTLDALAPGRWRIELTAGDAYRLRYDIEVTQ